MYQLNNLCACMVVIQKQYYKTVQSSGKYAAQGIAKSCQNLKCNNFCITILGGGGGCDY